LWRPWATAQFAPSPLNPDLDIAMNCAKTAELIAMPFVVWTQVGRRNHVPGGRPDSPGEGAIFWASRCDAAFRQNSVTICCRYRCVAFFCSVCHDIRSTSQKPRLPVRDCCRIFMPRRPIGWRRRHCVFDLYVRLCVRAGRFILRSVCRRILQFMINC